MKIDTSFPTTFLFNPEFSPTDSWSAAHRSQPRSKTSSVRLAAETQIDYKQELICGVILVLCLLFGFAAFVAQFALA